MRKMSLKLLRIDAGMTQEEVSTALGISPSTWSKWENGKSFPDVLDIVKIEQLFNISYSDIKFLTNNTV